jgi:2-keto-3-deoxy-L-rhamnonate aldolase RhmA
MPVMRYAAVAPEFANQAANEATLVICMIETERALKAVE